MSESWKAVIDADLKDAEYTPREPIKAGTYEATVTDVKARIFASRSKGLQITYTLQGGEFDKRELRDFIVIEKADGTVDRRGAATAKKLMLECGLDTKAILKFKFPEYGSTSFGDFKFLLDQPVSLDIKQETQKSGPYAGKAQARVKAFRAREAA